jgi:hypothetical protein
MHSMLSQTNSESIQQFVGEKNGSLQPEVGFVWRERGARPWSLKKEDHLSSSTRQFLIPLIGTTTINPRCRKGRWYSHRSQHVLGKWPKDSANQGCGLESIIHPVASEHFFRSPVGPCPHRILPDNIDFPWFPPTYSHKLHSQCLQW